MNLDKILEQLTTIGTTWGLKIIGVLVALFISWIFAGWVRNRIQRGLDARRFDQTLGRFFANLARYAILVGAVLGCLGVFGIQTASFAAVIAAMGLAVGLALQGTLGNFASGVMLLVFRPFKVGDVVKVAGEIGKVAEIELFTCELTTPDNRRIIIPNNKVFGNVIENITHHPTRRVDVAVGTDYGADLDQVREVLEGCIVGLEGVLEDPKAQVFLKEMGASSIDWVVRVWVNTPDFWDVHQRLVRAMKKALDEAGIGIPFPQMDVHFDEPVAAGLAAVK